MTTSRSLTVSLALLFLGVRSLMAQAHQATHAPAPQQKLGTVHFQTSCAPAVAPRFDHAVALLHSFDFGQSIKAFNDVLAGDSTCAMAYWGIALSRWTNPLAPGTRAAAQLRSGKEAAVAAVRLGGRATGRERGYRFAAQRVRHSAAPLTPGSQRAPYCPSPGRRSACPR